MRATISVRRSLGLLSLVCVIACNQAFGAAATHLTVALQNPGGSYITYQMFITALDATNAIDTTYTGTVAVTSSDPGFVNLGPVTLVNGQAPLNYVLKTAGTQTVTATDTVNSTITGTGSALVLPGPPHYVSVGVPANYNLGVPFTVTVTVYDLVLNVVTGFSGTVHFTSTDGTAILPADSTVPNGNGSFQATFNSKSSQTITVTDAADGVTGTSNPSTTTTGFAFANPNPVSPGTPFSFTVTAVDINNAAVPNYTGTVHFTSTDPIAVLPADSTLTNGSGMFSATLNTNPSDIITATDTNDSSITGNSGSITLPVTLQSFSVD